MLAAGALAAIIFNVKSGGPLLGAVNSAVDFLESRLHHQKCTKAMLQALKFADKKDLAADDVQVLRQGVDILLSLSKQGFCFYFNKVFGADDIGAD